MPACGGATCADAKVVFRPGRKKTLIITLWTGAQWLGRVSYSLYLTHWIVLKALGPWGVLVVLPVAWAVWWAVERPSIAASRRIGRRARIVAVRRGAAAFGAFTARDVPEAR